MSGGGIGNLGALKPEASGVPSAYGMTLRDYFAAKAMEAMLGYVFNSDDDAPNRIPDANIAARAYMMANAMLKVRDA